MKNCTRHRASEWFIPFLTSTAFVEVRKLYEVAMRKVPAIANLPSKQGFLFSNL